MNWKTVTDKHFAYSAGFISLSRTRRHPERYQGTKQVNAAIIIGMLTIVVVVLILIIVTVY